MSSGSLHTTEMQGLVELIQQGDEAAREELLRRIGGRMEQIARRMLKDFRNVRRWEDTADVLQNASLRLLRALREVRPASMAGFFGLAAQQVRRELLDLARRYKSRKGQTAAPANSPDSTKEFDLPDPAVDADLEVWEAFHEAAGQLADREREVFELVFYHGWAKPEAAVFLKVDERTVRRRWQAAVAALAARLDGRLPEIKG